MAKGNGGQVLVVNRDVDVADAEELGKLREVLRKQKEYIAAGMKPEHADVAACIWVYGTPDGSESGTAIG